MILIHVSKILRAWALYKRKKEITTHVRNHALVTNVVTFKALFFIQFINRGTLNSNFANFGNVKIS